MPTPIETMVPGYASCYDPRCPGYEQETVDVLRREVLFMREEYGGDVPGIDHSTICAVDESVSACPHCGGPRIAALEERHVYPPISGQDPLALLDLNKDKRINQVQIQGLEQQAVMAQMQTQMAEMRLLMERQQAELDRRKGGRPRKDPEDE